MLELLDSFAEFCRTKDYNEEYNYQDPKNCPIAQYAVHMGMADQYYGLFDEKKIVNPDEHYPFVEAEIYAATKPHTFGALADRIKERVHADKFGA